MNKDKINESIQIAEEVAKEICTQEPSLLPVADRWKKESPALYEELLKQLDLEEEMKFHESIDVDESLAALHKRMSSRSQRRLFLQITSLAASVLILVGTAVTWLNVKDEETQESALVVDWTEAIPGNEKSIITTADHQQVELDSYKSVIKGNQLIAGIEGKHEKIEVDADKVIGFNRLTVPAGGRHELALEDGTEVKINTASELLFPAHFMNPRIVRLLGEAYFKVRSDKENPFIVQLGDLQVVVTGTSFNVKSYPDDKEITVALSEGKVVINRKHEELVDLVPGELFTYNKETGDYKVEQTDLTTVTSWAEGMFVFRKEPIKNIMKTLSRWYNIKISVSKDVEDVCYTGVLMSKQPLRETLDMLRMTDELDFQYQEGKQVDVEEKRK